MRNGFIDGSSFFSWLHIKSIGKIPEFLKVILLLCPSRLGEGERFLEFCLGLK